MPSPPAIMPSCWSMALATSGSLSAGVSPLAASFDANFASSSDLGEPSTDDTVELKSAYRGSVVLVIEELLIFFGACRQSDNKLTRYCNLVKTLINQDHRLPKWAIKIE